MCLKYCPSKSRLFAPFLLIILLSGYVVAATPEPDGKRYAVLIGIDDYADSSIVKLATARNDASDLGARLVSSGWDKVFVLKDDVDYRNQDFPSRTNIENRINLLADLVKPDDTIFLFFSGHGVTNGKEASILPVDASLTRLADTGIPLSSLVATFTKRGLHKVVLAVDACREQVSVTKGLSVVGITGGTAAGSAAGKAAGSAAGNATALTLFSTKSGWYSYEDANGRNGVFTRILLDGLSGSADGTGAEGSKDGIVTFSELAGWLPDATGSYALDRGIRQQAVAYQGSGDSSALAVSVSEVGRVADSGAEAAVATAMAPVTAPAVPVAPPASGASEAFASLEKHITQIVNNSVSKIDGKLAKALEENANDSADSDAAAIKAELEADRQEELDRQAERDRAESARERRKAEREAKDAEEDRYAGFGILQLGLFSPMQILPKSYDVYGLAAGVIQTHNRRVFVLQAAPITVATTVGGVQTGAICVTDNIVGLQSGWIVNHADNVYGVQFGFINTADKVCGVQAGFINTAKELHGVQLGFINVISQDRGLFGHFMFGFNVGF